MSAQLQWTAERPVSDLLRYSAQSHTRFRHGPLRRTAALQDYLNLPPGLNPRTMAWASELRRDPALGGDPARMVDAVLQRLRTGGYQYTLEPGVYGQNTADEFWFDRRTGFCEHIASAFAIMMRSLDIPARIVTGYQGGEANSVDGFWILRQSDAHAWTEVWLAGRGWVRVDPTSAVSPGRTGSLQRLRPVPGAVASALQAVNPQFWLGLRATWEAVNNRWNQWILNYNQSTQLDLLKGLGFESPSWEDLGYVLLALIGGIQPGRRRMDLVGPSSAGPLAASAGTCQPQTARRRLAGRAGQSSAPDRADRVRALGGSGRPYPDAHALAARAGVPALRPTGRPRSHATGPIAARILPTSVAQVMSATLRSMLITCLLCLCLPGADAAKASSKRRVATESGAGALYASRDDVMRQADDIAERRGLDRDWVRAAIGQSRHLPQVARWVLPAASPSAKNWRIYRSRFIDPVRIRAGVAFWQANASELERAEQVYGVPAEIIVGIIGVETIYGRNTGNFRVMDALSTLAFDFPQAHPRAAERRAFFLARTRTAAVTGAARGQRPDGLQRQLCRRHGHASVHALELGSLCHRLRR